MGLCASIDAAAAIETAANVILPGGSLREYPIPVTASEVLRKFPPSSYFLCCANDMDVDGHLHAIPHGEELEAGQIYFVLPRSMLRRRLGIEEMAELAVRASATLTIGAPPCVSGDRRSGDGDLAKGGEELKRRRRAGKAGRGRGRKFVAQLSAIPE